MDRLNRECHAMQLQLAVSTSRASSAMKLCPVARTGSSHVGSRAVKYRPSEYIPTSGDETLTRFTDLLGGSG